MTIIFQNFFSDATITINLKDVNDNYPIFDQDQYSVSINENVFPESMVQTVRATDRDTGKYGEIVYSIEGQGSDAFTIDPKHGHIQVNLYFFHQFCLHFFPFCLHYFCLFTGESCQ